MKIIRTIYEYRYQPNEILSYLKNRISNVFWRHNTAKSHAAYYEINREIFDSVDEMVSILNADFTMSRDLINHHDPERVEWMVKERLSTLIVEELFKSDKIFIIQREHPYTGDHKYSVSIPFVNRVLEEEQNEN